MSSRKIVLAFDVYGTLLSTESIAEKLAAHFGQEKAGSVAAKWRLYQLEYTWRSNSMNKYESFSSITRKALRHALNEQRLSLSEEDTDAMMHAYDSLSTFPDVKDALTSLEKDDTFELAYFTQADYAMVSASVTKSPELSQFKTFKIVTSEATKKFKPAPETYHHLLREVGRKDFAGLWLVSGNPFDIVGARTMGMNAAWVDRAGGGWADCLGEPDLGPSVIVKDVGEIAEKVKAYTKSS